MIYYIDSKIFIDKFIENESYDRILKTQYIIVSSIVKKGSSTKFDKNIIYAESLYPDPSVLSSTNYALSYYNYLNEPINKSFLATIIKEDLKGKLKGDVVFICSRWEQKDYGYFKILKDFIIEEFGYPMFNYNKISDGKGVRYDKNVVLKNISKSIDERYNELENSEMGRKKIVSGMGKRDMVKKLKSLDLYSESMSKSEMKEVLQEFYVDY